MKRYIKKPAHLKNQPKSEYLNWDGDLVHNSYGTVVFEEEESGPIFSGILDSDGEPIFYLIEKNRIGF